jgi:hypothetical protein
MEIITDIHGVEHIIIDRGNGEFTSMPKSVYDEQQAVTEKPATSWIEPVLTK